MKTHHESGGFFVWCLGLERKDYFCLFLEKFKCK